MAEEEQDKQEDKQEKEPQKVTYFIQPEDAYMEVKWEFNLLPEKE